MKYLREKAVTAKLDIHKSTFRRWIQRGWMPQPTKLTAGTSVWVESDIDAAVERMAAGGEA